MPAFFLQGRLVGDGLLYCCGRGMMQEVNDFWKCEWLFQRYFGDELQEEQVESDFLFVHVRFQDG